MQLIDPPEPDWARCAALARRFGASFFVAHPARFERNARGMLEAFRAHYPNTRMGYSYKTNYLPRFIRLADRLGAYSEVVSQFELELARGLGIPGDRIVFNGPIKRRAELAEALGAGVRVNVDSLPELEEVMRLAPSLRGPVAIGVRAQLACRGEASRFGIDLGSSDWREALAAIDASRELRIAGLHVHCTGDRSAATYRDRARAVIEYHHRALGGRPLDSIDVGGGFAGPMPAQLAQKLASPPADFEAYASAVAHEMRAAYGPAGPELIIEPGMALLADAMTFVTRVEIVKRSPRRLAVVDGSRFHLQPPWNLARVELDLPIRVIAAPDGGSREQGRWDVVGPTCIERDVLYEGFEGMMGTGDFLAFGQVGAYTTVFSAPFIRATPPIVELDEVAGDELLRPASTAQGLLQSYEQGGQGP